MADRSSSGKEIVPRPRRMDARKVEVQILRLKASALEAQNDIETALETVERRKEQIVATEEQIREAEERFAKLNQELSQEANDG